VRKGLLLVGAAIVLLGVGVLAASFSLGSTGAVTLHNHVAVSQIAANSTYTLLLSGANESSATVNLLWSSPQYLHVAVYAPGSCPHGPGICPSGPPLVTWTSDSGLWTYTGRASFPLILNLTNSGTGNAAYNVTLLESYSHGTWSDPTLVQLLPLAGAIVLVGIGGIAVFLGLFLRSGVYTGPAPVKVPADFDDEELEGIEDADAPIDNDEL
jgi:hypothetical protein